MATVQDVQIVKTLAASVMAAIAICAVAIVQCNADMSAGKAQYHRGRADACATASEHRR